MFSINTESDMVECPYDPAHRMLRKRLQQHLVRCKLNHPDIELQACPFNKTHLVSEAEYVNHVTNCPDKAIITDYKYNTVAKKEDEEEVVKHAPIECEENWDDTEVEDYNPLKHADIEKLKRRPVYCIANADSKKELLEHEWNTKNSDQEDDKESINNDSENDSNTDKRHKIDSEHSNGQKKPPNKEFKSKSVGVYNFVKNRPRPRPRSPVRYNAPYYNTLYSARVTPSPPPPPPLINIESGGRTSPEEYSLDEDPYYNRGTASTGPSFSHSSRQNHRNHPYQSSSYNNISYPRRGNEHHAPYGNRGNFSRGGYYPPSGNGYYGRYD